MVAGDKLDFEKSRLCACSFFYLLSHLADIIKIIGICAKEIEVMIYMAVPGTF